MIEKAKRIATGLLLLASLLPLAQCKSKEPIQAQNVEVNVTLREQTPQHHPGDNQAIHVWKDFKPADPQAWTLALAFIWPVPLILMRVKSHSRRIETTTKLLEIPLCALTGYLLYCLMRDPLWQLLSGGYVAMVGIGIYLFAMVADIAWWKRKPAGN